MNPNIHSKNNNNLFGVAKIVNMDLISAEAGDPPAL